MPLFLTLLSNRFVIIGIAAVSLFGVYKYQAYRIDSLNRENLTLSADLKTVQNNMKSMQTAYIEIVKARTAIDVKAHELEKKNKALEDTLYRETRKRKSLETLAERKSSLVEKAVNKGTLNVLRCIESASRGEDCL